MVMPTVTVLLSTYNGQQYLPEQLKSLSIQEDVNISLLVRDDGSSDSTVSIIERWSDRIPTTLISGANRGAVASFLELIYATRLDSEYYAFCDQDDYWRPTKLKNAVDSLSCLPEGHAALYCSSMSVTDAHLTPRYDSPTPRRPVSFGNALVQNVATGCTVVINKKLMEIVQSKRISAEQIVMHDWWLLLLATAVGHVIYDPVPGILYRQHGANEVGHKQGFGAWKLRAKRFLHGRLAGRISRQARAFNEAFGHLITEDKHKLLEECFMRKQGIRSAVCCVGRKRLFRQNRLDDLVLRLLYLLKKV